MPTESRTRFRKERIQELAWQCQWHFILKTTEVTWPACESVPESCSNKKRAIISFGDFGYESGGEIVLAKYAACQAVLVILCPFHSEVSFKNNNKSVLLSSRI